MTRYSTKDLNEAAFLWCQRDVQLIGLEPEPSKPSTFYMVFETPFEEKSLDNMLLAYANGKTAVDPKLFVQKQNGLRDQLSRHKRL